ncbi:MAG: DMT family transporter [Deltaproteobacteria bacterium]|nr:DMT family transporter [Deltaproteobacteria bacterium]
MHPSVGIALALVSAASWAVGSTIYKRLGRDVPAIGLNLVTSLLGMVLLAAATIAGGGPHLPGSAPWMLALSGVVGITVGDTLFFLALGRLDAHAVVTLTMLAPVLTIGLAVAGLGERPAPFAWLGIALVLGGVGAVLSGQLRASAPALARRGLGYGLGAVVAMAAGTVLAKVGMRDTSALDATLVRVGAGTLGLAAVAAVRGGLVRALAPCVRPSVLPTLLAGVAVVTLGGFWALHASLQAIDVAVAATLHATEPLFILPIAAAWLGERVTWRSIGGAAASVCGVALLYLA